MPVNYRVLRKELVSQSAKVRVRAQPQFEKRFEETKKTLLQDFDTHEVTKEIQRGPTTHRSMIPVGNLFSLLGFDAGEHPTTPLRAYLKKEIKLDKGSIGLETNAGKILLRGNVTIPTLDEIYDHTSETTPLPEDWPEGRSWVQLVERGIPGFPRFLSVLDPERGRKRRFRIEGSHSGTAIQVKTKDLRGGSVGPISYVNGLLASFKARISRNKR